MRGSQRAAFELRFDYKVDRTIYDFSYLYSVYNFLIGLGLSGDAWQLLGPLLKFKLCLPVLIIRQFLQLCLTSNLVIISGIFCSQACLFITQSTIFSQEYPSSTFNSLFDPFLVVLIQRVFILGGLSGLEWVCKLGSNLFIECEQCFLLKDIPYMIVVIKYELLIVILIKQCIPLTNKLTKKTHFNYFMQDYSRLQIKVNNNNWMKDECYEFLKNQTGKVQIVGFGSYGEVKLARNTENGEVVAIKMIYNKNAKEEIDVHHKLNHPNIIKLLNYYYQKEKNTTYMVLEYASGGSLNEKIKFGYGQLSKQLVKRYFRDICEAVRYLHQNNYMHRDIKPENILITKDNHAKLCDFGFASILEYRSTLCGTFEYMAPEMIQKKPYDYKIDIWGLGILLFELIQGYAPFRGETGQQVIAEMKKPLIFSNRFDAVQIDLIKKILRVNSENRLEISKIFEHPYFKDSEEELPKEQPKVEQRQEPTKQKEFRFPKDIRELKEEVSAKPVKLQTADISKKKEGERKFDFLQRKGEPKKDFKISEKLQETAEKMEKKQINKEVAREQPKREQKKEFKPYVPPSLQNQRSGIKSPLMKQLPPNYVPLPLSPTGFQQNPHQFNSSMQMPPSHVQSNPLNTNAYQFPNPNASMSNAVKHFPPTLPQQPVYQGNFAKPVGPSYFIEQRSPNHQSFNNSQQQPIQQVLSPGYPWKKS